MRSTTLKRPQLPTVAHDVQLTTPPLSSWDIGLCALALLLCTLLVLSPLTRLVGVDHFAAIAPFVNVLLSFSSWLPVDLHLIADPAGSARNTSLLLSMGVAVLAFIIYGISLWLIARKPANADYRIVQRWIWAIALLGGLCFVFTPAMLSNDVFVYAGYGRLVAAYHASPYFDLLTNYPDTLNLYDDWRGATCAYGPFWLVICMIVSAVAGPHVLPYILIYRLLALASNLCNIFLVALILRKMGRSNRTVTMGMLLYAWNPLMLQENGLGGHNDTVMVTFLLLGIYLWMAQELRALEERLTARDYLPALVCLTISVLIKYSSAPLVILFFVLLGRRAMLAAAHNGEKLLGQLREAGRDIAIGGLACAGLVLFCYLPFWLGHGPAEIIQSFSSPPSSYLSYNSIQQALGRWLDVNRNIEGTMGFNFVASFTQRFLWQVLNVASVGLMLLIGLVALWFRPTLRVWALSSIALLSLLYLVTTWIFPWYITWIIGLACICLPMQGRLPRALVGTAFQFTVTIHFLYLFFFNVPPFGRWIGLDFLTTLLPPIVTFMVLCFWRIRRVKPVSLAMFVQMSINKRMPTTAKR
ncbi:hypothetical protein [Ktedonospora formicarum]|uniref:Uncharacterized protein n=1 Tax=Ktedonospora formicarum TaxID=2778364 RepID=A0A8J3I5N1_9CHLR|nr:hypothetical protein [Ktedonospora formicarum]GHO50024.1 hypothetical protein KSX_81870 [Ktedonospora formicarum]